MSERSLSWIERWYRRRNDENCLMGERKETITPELAFHGWTGVSHQKLGKGGHFNEEKVWKSMVDQKLHHGLPTKHDPFSVLPISPSIPLDYLATSQLSFPHGVSSRWILPFGSIWFYPFAPMPPDTRAPHLLQNPSQSPSTVAS